MSAQYINQTPMGVKVGPPILTPRLEGIHAALVLYDYPRDHWAFLAEWAVFLIAAVHDLDGTILPKPLRFIGPEDVEP